GRPGAGGHRRYPCRSGCSPGDGRHLPGGPQVRTRAGLVCLVMRAPRQVSTISLWLCASPSRAGPAIPAVIVTAPDALTHSPRPDGVARRQGDDSAPSVADIAEMFRTRHFGGPAE